MAELATSHLSQQQCRGKLGAVSDALYVIGGKWKLRIVLALDQGHKRFNEIQRAVTGISARVLSHELKELEINGFVQRKICAERSVVIEYELTEYSSTLQEVLEALSRWGEMHQRKIRTEL